MLQIPIGKGYRQPAEWDLHEACWLAWPSHGDLWRENLRPAQCEFSALCRAISGLTSPVEDRLIENLKILVPDGGQRKAAQEALGGLPVEFFEMPYGDIWLRDTAPIFLTNAEGDVASVQFAFNGWGQKYLLPHDTEVAAGIAGLSETLEFKASWILEGGSVETDGEGTFLTSRQCLLNSNRNTGMTQAQIEGELKNWLGAEKVLWLGEGLLNDHTDGHIDTIARFVSPGRVVCMAPATPSDPNAKVLGTILSKLNGFTDARGRKLEIQVIPSPGRIVDSDQNLLPASYLNFYIANRSVVVPTYGSPYDVEAVAKIAALFPNRKTIGLSAKAILTGGGAFHCITQQQPFNAHKRSHATSSE